MKKLRVNLSQKTFDNSYDILISNNYYSDFSSHIKKVYDGNRLFVITDDNLYKIYKDEFKKMFENFEYFIYVIKSGEENKRLENIYPIYEKMASLNISRKDMVVAFGGGVVGDMAGFVAATYMRGISYIQIPTSLLAQVDSSVGGKTAVDLLEGKNLVGAFHQPKLVLIDTKFLETLEDYYFIDGIGEIVKYGCIYDESLFNNLLNFNKNSKNIEDIIYRSCEIKKEIVEKDEKEEGLRMILNFGHSIGHAIEKITGYTKYSHGRAVSLGMCDMCEIGEKLNYTEKGTREKLVKVLESVGLATKIEYDMNEIKKAMFLDKKNSESGINLIFIEKIGKAIIKKTKIENFGEIE